MVDHLSQYGDCLGSVNGHTFHKFPTLEQLAVADEATLRKAGFGYRAKFIEGTVKVGSTLGFTFGVVSWEIGACLMLSTANSGFRTCVSAWIRPNKSTPSMPNLRF
jgi:hypothetical protein